MAEFLGDPVAGLQGLQQLVTNPEMRAALGEQIVGDFTARIDRMNQALLVVGDANAEQLGKDIGELLWQVTSVTTGVAGAGAAGAKLASVGVKVGSEALENTALALNRFNAGAVKGFKSAETVNAEMLAANKFLPPGQEWTPAWKPRTQVADVTVQPGTKVQMVVSEDAYKAMEKGDMSRAGGWATFDNVTSQAQARNSLAITSDMKPNVGYVIEVEVTKPINAKVGVVGEQGTAAGGGNQIQFVVPRGETGNIFKFVSGKAIK